MCFTRLYVKKIIHLYRNAYLNVYYDLYLCIRTNSCFNYPSFKYSSHVSPIFQCLPCLPKLMHLSCHWLWAWCMQLTRVFKDYRAKYFIIVKIYELFLKYNVLYMRCTSRFFLKIFAWHDDFQNPLVSLLYLRT